MAISYLICRFHGEISICRFHELSHTFCTNLANAGMNPKALQYIMGHSNITMTLNYYAHATFASARAEMERLIAA
ncbi:tyrosine-type recombinase/integrase [Acutalibacter sp. JLR.KK004]|uniref:tyrosine-type recombinase/integrase n=1 Tax=Acutalibacter sp. JLR.KK004 TaxID=3112622 RepID=UPI002FF33B3D